MPRKKILSNKSEIIDVALELIESEGLEAVSMRRLSKEMDVSNKTLYNYVLNADAVLREVLIRSFTGVYEQIFSTTQKLIGQGYEAPIAYAKAFGLTLYGLAQVKSDICAYLIGPGYEKYHDDAELRHLYDPFGDVVMSMSGIYDTIVLKRVFDLYEGALLSQIRNHISGVHKLEEDEFEAILDLLIELMFGNRA